MRTSARFAVPFFIAAALNAFSNANAQDIGSVADTIVVFDGSGSMWGQIQGKTKIEIARETLSSVLSEVPAQNRIGMIAYGHRQKGVCADIETVVPVGPANQSVPQMINVANALLPKGKTPLSDAVRIAAEELKYTENAATVILVTDGIETCNADPCALANELESAGVGFTAHVIGFGLTEEEGRQVQCLADNTGGFYLPAQNADELKDALQQTVEVQPIPYSDDDFGPEIAAERNVRFLFKDVEGGDLIGIRQLSGYLERDDGTDIANENFQLSYPEANGNSATGSLEPGSYVARLNRNYASATDIIYAFDVPEGEGEFVVEAILGSTVKINLFINPKLAWVKGDAFPTAVGRSRPRFNLEIFPLEGGETSQDPLVKLTETSDLSVPLSIGSYLIRGNIDSGTSVERVLNLTSGGQTEFDFSFDATRVFIDARETSGQPVKRQTTYWYDKVPSGRNYWVSGGGRSEDQLTPFYLPTGSFITNVGGEGYGKRRSEVVVNVPGDFEDLIVEVGESLTLDADDQGYFSQPDNSSCIEILKVTRNGCLVEKADFSSLDTDKPANEQDDDITPPAIVSDWEKDLDGLSGTAYVFVDTDLEPQLFVVFENEDGSGMADVILRNEWCGTADCEEHVWREPAKFWDLLLENSFVTKRAGLNAFTLDVASFGDDKEVTISGGGYPRTQLTFFDRIKLDKPKTQTDPEPVAPVDPEKRSGISLKFGDDQKRPLVEIVVMDGLDDVTILLEDGWCGREGCYPDSFVVPFDKIKNLVLEGYRSASFGAGRYRLEFETFGDNKTFWVTENSGQRVRFDLLEKLSLGSQSPNVLEPTSPQVVPSEKTEKVSLTDKVNRVFGIFRLDGSGASIDDITSDFLHVQSCQRSPIIIYPDHTIAFKKFEAPNSENENPFKTAALGNCQVSGSTFDCSIEDLATGQKDIMSFTSILVGDNHYDLTMADGKKSIAASCFHPNGELDANQIMPGGKVLYELMISRDDGNKIGIGYDKNNNIYKDGLK